ncbi:hypothetical protein BDV95DRAFT_483756 [Massariosphaeria phaeospora]|uniref:Uncharacterized protein n=1 Tax=Massariosphaeria phaeospora TaxID=100035 RepID=A0A7C8ID79_9PLEO|nr:hypothetical protein BDV95DRAFT_483756 [Massariosphaeria phaeospora]
MAFRQHHRPQPPRQRSFHAPEPLVDVGPLASAPRKRPLEHSEEWVLFSPAAASAAARTQSTSTGRTPHTAGLSRLSDFGSLDTAARSAPEADDATCQGTEDGEELDSLDDGLHAFHEPSDYGAPPERLQPSGDTVLPTHDGLGTFQPGAAAQDHMWQFERQAPRRRLARRRSSVQRRLDALEEAEEIDQVQDRRLRIEKWRMDQSKALLEEIERETRRQRRMSVASAARIAGEQSDSSDDSAENLSLWQRLTRRVIRDLMGIDEDTLSVIFGEALPVDALSPPQQTPTRSTLHPPLLQTLDVSFSAQPWEHRLLQRVARELGTLVHQLSEHPGAFSTYLQAREAPEYVGLTSNTATSALDTGNVTSSPTGFQPSALLPNSAQFAPTFPTQQASIPYSESSLWGIEEHNVDPLDSFRTPPAPVVNTAEELVHEREYWERELDVKMVFNFLVKRFSSRSSVSRRRSSFNILESTTEIDREASSARRAALIRQHHPLVNRNSDRVATSNAQENRRRDAGYRTSYHAHQPPSRSQALRSSSSCVSQSTKKSKRSNASNRNYWDLGGSVGSGSVIAGEAHMNRRLS